MNSSIFMLIYIITIIFLIPGSVLLIVFTTRAFKKRNFRKKYGCSPQYYEQLKKLKELYDCGILTAEEYEAKKKKFLGL